MSSHFFATFLLLLIAPHLFAAEVYLPDNLLYVSLVTQPDSLVCRYEKLNTELQIQSVSAKINELELPVLKTESYPTERDLTVILFLVDVSDPRRQAVIEKNKVQLKQLLELAKPHHHFGLSIFATDLNELAPLGTATEEMFPLIEEINATGQTTELYKHTLAAVKTLAAYPAQRKAIFIFSDGGAEDTAYTHQEVVDTAKNAHIRIYGLGFSMSTSASVNLQTLEKLSQETQGLFFKADNQYRLPASFLDAPYTLMDSGQKITFDLKPAIALGLTGQQETTITWQTASDPLQVTQLIEIENPVLPLLEGETLLVEDDEFRFEKWQLGLLTGGGILFILLIWLIFRPLRPYAYLESNQLRYPIRLSTVRIGRHSDNELTLNNTSVSSHHAELHRRRDGQFVIVDLDSLNGVYINGQLSKTGVLANGDNIEIGEVKLLFIKK